jgi:hypothetical protein
VPPLPKDRALLQRRNRTSTRATLPTEEAASAQEVRPLFDLGKNKKWHPQAVAWWEKVCTSPMASEYLEADWEDLFMLARVVQDFWTAKKASDRRALIGEIRQQGQRFGISPIDRRRLQWEVEKGEQADERTQKRRQLKAPPAAGVDPRDLMKLA